LSADQDWQTSRVLDFEAVFREVFVVSLPFTTIAPDNRALAQVPNSSIAAEMLPEVSVGMLTPRFLQPQDMVKYTFIPTSGNGKLPIRGPGPWLY